MGLLSAGSNLDICWLRAQHIGSGLLMTEIADGAHGVWAQAEKTRTWLKTVVAGTEIDLVPPQTSKEEAAIIHLGTIDPIEVPKLDAIRFYIAGIPTPAQSLEYRIRDTFDANDCPICRFEKPIIIGPEKKQQIRVYPYASGDDKTELLSFLITKAEDLLLTVT